MSTTAPSLPVALPRRRARSGAAARLRAAARPELLALLVLAAVLDLWGLSRNGVANEYYAAAVRSMSSSWHAFLFGSFDVSGLQTVDKPPLALWVEALSVRAFGSSSWSMLAPQALMGVASVGLTYDLVRVRFGRAAGLAGGLALALTPITVAVSRHNNPDALLVLCCTAALWACVRGLEAGRARYLVGAGVAIGLGFETKMAVALMVLPGIAAAWLWVAPRGRRIAARQLAAAGAACAAVGLAWPALVWLTPAADRPWISGTSDNSIWSLILGYNGLGRLVGQSGGAGGGGGSMFGGTTGPLRLLNESLGGQAGWLLGTAVVAVLGLAALTRLRRTDARTGWVLAVGASFACTALAFSTAKGIFHPYYTSLLAPFTAALAGAVAGLALERSGRGRLVAALALGAGGVTEIVVLRTSAAGLAWLVPVLAVGCAAGGVTLATASSHRARGVAVGAVIALLLAAPASWAVQTLGHATSGTFPTGGPASAGMTGGPGGGGGTAPGGGTRSLGGASAAGGIFGGDDRSLTAAVAYAKAHGGGAIGVSSQSSAASAIIASGANVVGLGGFSGNETQISAAWLAQEVQAGHIRYVLTSSSGGVGISAGRVGSTEIMALVKKVGTKVSGVSGLYDLQGKAAALAAG